MFGALLTAPIGGSRAHPGERADSADHALRAA